MYCVCVFVCVCENREREKFMSSVRSEDGSPAALSRNVSVPWAFIDETDEGSEV